MDGVAKSEMRVVLMLLVRTLDYSAPHELDAQTKSRGYAWLCAKAQLPTDLMTANRADPGKQFQGRTTMIVLILRNLQMSLSLA